MLVTMISARPGRFEGVVQVRDPPPLVTLTFVQVSPPTVTVAPATKSLAPLETVMVVLEPPDVGVTAEIVGAAA
jgi:hypothetical protein